MPTTKRFYLRSSGAAAVSPAYGSSWEYTGGATRYPMAQTTANTPLTADSALAPTGGLKDNLVGQFVGPNDLAAGTYQGSAQIFVAMGEGSSIADQMLQVRLSIVSSDGATERGVLYAGQTAVVTSATSTDPNYAVQGSTSPALMTARMLLPTLTPVVAQAGDRIVAELGSRIINPNGTNRTSHMTFGDPTAGGDLSTVGQAGDALRPFVEFVFDDLIAPPDTPIALSVTPSPDGTELLFEWTAAGTGDPEDGFEVRIDGGSPIDVGTDLDYTFTGLTPDTAYTLEVRAYNAAGESSWASIGATTTGPPDTPTGLIETVITSTSVKLDWTASTGDPDGYEVRVDGGASTDVGNVVTHTFTGLFPGSTPVLEVRAYNEAGFSAWASVESEIPPPTESEFTATITLGEHEWTIAGNACDFEEPVQVLDSLRIGWEVSESDPWPAQPGAVSCSLGLWTADVAELEDVVIGTPMSVVLTDVLDNVFASFHGRVARQSARIRRDGPGSLSMLYSLTGMDYTVDLTETPVTVVDEAGIGWPAEDGIARMGRVFTALTAAGVTMGANPGDYGVAEFAELSAGTTTAAALLEDHLRQIVVDNGDGPQRYIVVPVVTGGVLERFDVVLLERTVDASLLPGTLDLVGGELVIVFPDLDADGLIDACDVDLGVTWNRLKYRAVNVVTVTADEGLTGTASNSGPPVRLNLDSTLTTVDALQAMAELYLPDVDETNGWVADTFHLYAHRQPNAIVPAWFPDHSQDPADTSVYVMPFAVMGIPANVNLAGETAYAGQLVNVTLTIQNKRAGVEFALRRQLPASTGDDVITWDWIAAEFPTLSWDDVSETLSWYDVRLGRIP